MSFFKVKGLIKGLDRGEGVYGKAYWGSGYEIHSEFPDLDLEEFQQFEPR